MLCGSAFKNKGVQPLLDAIIWYLPSPLDVPPLVATSLKGEEVTRAASDEEPFSALAFKIMSDAYVGRLTYLRVYSGVLKAGSHVLNSTRGPQGTDRAHPPDARQPPGGQGCRVHGRHRGRGRTEALHDRRHHHRPGAPGGPGAITFPIPVISVAVEPKTKADQDKLGNGLAKLSDEDPTFVVRFDDETGQTVSRAWASSTWTSWWTG